jgi:anti-sigma B factor antagonist
MSQETAKNFRVEDQGDVTVVTAVTNQIVAENRDDLYASIGRPGPGGAAGPKYVVLNLENVPQIQSAAIAILINFQKKVREAGGVLKVCGVTPNVLDVFRLIKMDQVFDIVGTTGQAVASFHGKAGSSGGGGWFSKFRGGKS